MQEKREESDIIFAAFPHRVLATIEATPQTRQMSVRERDTGWKFDGIAAWSELRRSTG
jgi:hypothetical protein